jgi:hypothetical protein
MEIFSDFTDPVDQPAATDFLVGYAAGGGAGSDRRWRFDRIISWPVTRTTAAFNPGNTTLAAVPGLSIPLLAGKTYEFESHLFTTSSSTDGVKCAIAASGGLTATAIVAQARVYDANAFKILSRAAALGTAMGAITAVTAAYIHIVGTIVVNIAGNLDVQFAQNASSANDSTVIIGSYHKARRIG